MVPECLCCSFRCIALVHVWWKQLKVNVLSWRLWLSMLKASLSSFWELDFKPLVYRILYNVLYAFNIDCISWFCCWFCYNVIAVVGIHHHGIFPPLKYLNGNFPVRSEYIFPFNSNMPAIISFVLSWMVVSFSSNIVSWFITFYSSYVRFSLIIVSLSGSFLMIGNDGGLKFLVDWMFW